MLREDLVGTGGGLHAYRLIFLSSADGRRPVRGGHPSVEQQVVEKQDSLLLPLTETHRQVYNFIHRLSFLPLVKGFYLSTNLMIIVSLIICTFYYLNL